MKSKFFSIIASPFFDFGKLSSLTDERELVTRMEGGQELTARDEHFVDDQVQDVIQFEPKLWMQRSASRSRFGLIHSVLLVVACWSVRC